MIFKNLLYKIKFSYPHLTILIMKNRYYDEEADRLIM